MSAVTRRALIVEDDRSWQQILGEILTDAGLAVDVTATLEGAIDCLRAAPHRLAVIDLSLSGGDFNNRDGLRVLDAVRRIDPGCVPIMLTGFATVELAVSALSEHAAFTCLRKETFKRAEFRALISKALASAPPVDGAARRSPDGDSRDSGTVEAGASAGIEPAAGSALIVEDDAGWRGILSELLTDAGYQVRACSGYGEALGCLRRETYVLAVVDLSLEGPPAPGAGFWERGLAGAEMDGFRLLASTRAGGIPTLVVSGVATPADIERAYAEHGIFAFVQKQTFDRRAFLQAVQEARAAAVLTSELDVLTAREREVVALLAQGMTNREIAAALFITTNTVKRHLKAIFAKLDVHTRSAAAAKAVEAGVSID